MSAPKVFICKSWHRHSRERAFQRHGSVMGAWEWTFSSEWRRLRVLRSFSFISFSDQSLTSVPPYENLGCFNGSSRAALKKLCSFNRIQLDNDAIQTHHRRLSYAIALAPVFARFRMPAQRIPGCWKAPVFQIEHWWTGVWKNFKEWGNLMKCVGSTGVQLTRWDDTRMDLWKWSMRQVFFIF